MILANAELLDLEGDVYRFRVTDKAGLHTKEYLIKGRTADQAAFDAIAKFVEEHKTNGSERKPLFSPHN